MSTYSTFNSHQDGRFVRKDSVYREIISSEHSLFQPEPNRYHLYISLACPWANRCYAVLSMKGLLGIIVELIK